MTRRNLAVGLGLASLAGIAVAAPTFAEEPVKPAPKKDAAKEVTTAAPKAPAGTATTGTAGTPAPKSSALADASKQMPMQEFGEGVGKDAAETAERLQKEFGTTNRRLGMVPFWPRGDMKVGIFRLMPYLREGVDYVSNFYRKKEHSTELSSPNGNDASWAWINQIGVMADARVNENLSIGAQVDAEWLLRFDNSGSGDEYHLDPITGQPTNRLRDDTKEDGFNFLGVIGATWMRDPFYVRGGYSFERLDDPIDQDFEPEFERRSHNTFLTWGLSRDVLFGTKMQFEMGASMNDDVGHEEGLEDHDRTETEYYLKVSYPFWRDSTRVFGRVRYREDERESEKINDGHVWGFDAGMEGSIPLSEGEGRGLRGRVSVGFDSALYEDDTYVQDGTTFRNDENSESTNVNVSVVLEYVQSTKSLWSLTYLRENRFTYHGNFQISDRVELAFNHQIRNDLRGRIATYFEYDDPSGNLRQDDNSDPLDQFPAVIDSEGNVDDGHTADTRDPITGNGDYPSSTRFGAGFGLRYAINESMDADLDYFWDRRNNRVDGYTQHHATAGITFYLNALRPKAKGVQP